MSEKKAKKPKLFQLAVMNQLVEQTPYLDAQYQKLKDGAQEKLGYHWNEVVQNVLFNRYVKPHKGLMAKYRTLLKQYRLDKKARKAQKKTGGPKVSKAASTTVEMPAIPPVVDAHGRVDTRLTMEADTASVGGSYETPYFLTTNKGTAHKFQSGMASMVGATLLESATSMKDSLLLTESAAALFSLPSIAHLEGLLQESSFAGTDHGASQARLDEIKRANEKAAKSQFQQSVDQSLDFTEKNEDGSATVKITNEVPLDKQQGHQPDADEAKHVRLNRGINALDQTLIAQPNLPKSLLDRYRDQAGAEFKNSEEKVKQYRKEDPEHLPPAQTKIIKESYLMGRDTAGNLHRMSVSTLQHVNEIPTGAQRLETRGLANGEHLLREGHEFYVNLPTQEFLCVPLAQAPAPAPMRTDRRAFEQMQHLTFYRSSK